MITRIRTAYSFRQAAGKIEEVMDQLQEAEASVAPISDTASAFGWVKWATLAEERGLRPIFGVELSVSPDPEAKRPTYDRWTFFALDSLEPLHHLIELATAQFRYEPLLSYPQALAAGCTIITGHRPLLDLMKPQVNLYIALAPSTPVGLSRKALKRRFKFMGACDNRYPAKGDVALYQTVCGRNASTQTYPQHILTKAEWEASVKQHPAGAKVRARKAANDFPIKHVAKLGQANMLKPKRPATLRKMCRDGAKLLGVDLKDLVYKARLDRELKLIRHKDFEDYFYIIADIVQWARERMIVGPARGSSCGSLVCYLLLITTIDPIPYGLIFERFIDINRPDLPDIDIDFSDVQRHLMFEYVAEKYGQDRVARLGTVALYRPRSALQEAAAALDVPPWEIKPVVDGLIERSSGDARALQTLEDAFTDQPAGIALIEKYPGMRITQRMEGHPRHHSQHAAGIIVTQEAVSKYVAIDSRSGATHCDKKDAEKLNMLKIDALGLTQLSIFEDCLGRLGLPHTFLDSLETDDPAAFDVLNRRHFAGVFQFNGLALKSLAKQITFSDLEDVISITALARPGPLASGGANEWVRRKIGEAPVTYPHEAFEPYLKNSMGIVIYQEQVMEIGRNIGDLSWEDVTDLRKAMSKSLGKEFFDQYGDRWKAGAAKKGISQEVLTKVWDDLCAYGSWSFNRSHSVAYGMISYQCCWLKAHHPVEFAAASLSHEADPEKQLLLLRELAGEGIGYLPVDPILSEDCWMVGEDHSGTLDGPPRQLKGATSPPAKALAPPVGPGAVGSLLGGRKILIGPLQGVKGIGPKLLQQIMSSRARGEPLPPRAAKLLANPITPVDELYPVTAAFARILPDPTTRNITTPPTKLVDLEPTGEWQDAVVFVTLRRIAPRNENDESKVASRGHRLTGPEWALNLQIGDDTDTILAKVSRYDYAEIAKPITRRGNANKALYALKGTMLPDFRMFMVKGAKYIGDIDD